MILEYPRYISSAPMQTDCPNFIELLQSHVLEKPEKSCFRFLGNGDTETEQLSYERLDQQGKAIAAHLQSRFYPGDRAILLYPPGLEFICAFIGCLYGGIVAVPAYPVRRQKHLSRLLDIIQDSQASVILTTADYLPTLEKQLNLDSGSNLQCIATDLIDIEQGNEWRSPPIDENSLAFLQYTSGSTGSPKGVMISHGNIIHNSWAINQCFQDTADSCGVSWLPPYHDMGLIGGLLQPLYVGASMVLMSPTSFIKKPIRWLQAISKYKATTSGGPDFAYDLLCRKVSNKDLENLDLSHWSVAFSGAEPIRAKTLDLFAKTFAVSGFRSEAFYPCYGMAESTLIISGGNKIDPPIIEYCQATALETDQIIPTASDDYHHRAIVGCGQACPDHTVLIVNPETHARCPESHVGEIWVSGPSVAQGYWNNPSGTDQYFKATVSGYHDTFLRTGDLGFLRDGELFITGRLKDLIIINGRNHYPQDIESTVENSHEALQEGSGVAFSIELKNQEKLVILQEVKRTHRNKLDMKEIVQSINQAVAEMHEQQVYAIQLLKPGSLPKTSSGKVRRRLCRSEFLQQNLPVLADWSINPQGKAAFQKLNQEVESLLHRVQTPINSASMS